MIDVLLMNCWAILPTGTIVFITEILLALGLYYIPDLVDYHNE